MKTVCKRLTSAFVCCVVTVVIGAPRPVVAADQRVVDAAKNKDTNTLRALLQQHADVNGAAADGSTALHWAVHWDDLSSVDLLLRSGANVNAANDYGAAPLYLARSEERRVGKECRSRWSP